MTWICLRFSQMVVQHVFFYHGLPKVTNSTNPREATGKPTLHLFGVCVKRESEFGDDMAGPGDISSSERSSPTPGAQRYSPRWVGE